MDAFGVGDFLRRMWERYTVKEALTRTVLEEAARVTQLETDGSWQKESPYKEELEFFRNIKDLRFDGSSMRKSYRAGKDGDWEVFLRHEKFSAWASVKVRECYNEAEQKEDDLQTLCRKVRTS